MPSRCSSRGAPGQLAQTMVTGRPCAARPAAIRSTYSSEPPPSGLRVSRQLRMTTPPRPLRPTVPSSGLPSLLRLAEGGKRMRRRTYLTLPRFSGFVRGRPPWKLPNGYLSDQNIRREQEDCHDCGTLGQAAAVPVDPKRPGRPELPPYGP